MHGTLPPASVPGPDGRPAHSWRVLLLPYLEQQSLYDRYRFDEPWDGPNNSNLAGEIPFVYRCPSFEGYHAKRGLETTESRRLTNYVAVEHPKAALAAGLQFRDCTDGLSNTLAVVESRQHSVHWMQPDDVTPTEFLHDLQSSAHPDQANHVGGTLTLFLDGAVHFIPSDTTADEIKRWIVVDDGEFSEPP